MSKYDVYLYENSKVLKNLLGITDEAELDLAESEYANAGMMFLCTKNMKQRIISQSLMNTWKINKIFA